MTVRVSATLLSLALLVGCRNDLTQVVLVIQSDLTVPAEANQIDVASVQGPFAPPTGQFVSSGTELMSFPSSVGFESGGMTTSFSVTVRLFTGANAPPAVLLSRTVTDIRFVPEQTMMLVLPMNRACACQGTSCPGAGDPECDNISQPTLLPFDPAVAPPSSMKGGFGGVIASGAAR